MEKKVDNKTMLISGFLGLMLVIGVMQAWQLSSLSGKLSSVNAPSASNLKASGSGGETIEEMNARMHPDQAQNSKPAQPAVRLPTGAAGLPAQVGGC